MKATELRIGNLVYGVYEDDEKIKRTICEVDVLDYVNLTEYEIWASSLDDSISILEYDQILPITLTEELLVKCDKLNENFIVDEDGFVILKNSYGYFFVREDYKHVHQLQNAYFALTNEELTIKEL